MEADPDSVLVTLGVDRRELDKRSTRWARILLARGIGARDLVIVSVSSPVDAVTAMWAVAKAGAAFGPGLPELLARARLGITTARDLAHEPAGSISWLLMDDPRLRAEAERHLGEPIVQAERVRPVTAEDPAWLYTRTGANGVEIVTVNHDEVAHTLPPHDAVPPELDLFTPAEQQEHPATRLVRLLLSSWHFRPAPAEVPDPPQTLAGLFDAVVARHPDAIALSSDTGRWTYTEIDGRANRLARRLIAHGVGPETIAAVLLPRGVDQVVALLAVVKAGGAYLPIDPAYPAERIAYLLDDARPVCALIDGTAEMPVNLPTLTVDDDTAFPSEPITDQERRTPLRPDHLAYVIYTSGSTGRPKGVQIPHRNVLALFDSTRALFDFDHTDVWTMFHSSAFDFSVWEMWGALLHGGRLHLVDLDTARSPARLRALLGAEQVTVLNQTPSAFHQLCAADRDIAGEHGHEPLSLRHIIFGGEALDQRSLTDWFDRHGEDSPRLVNMYGTTETTVHATHHALTRSGPGGIGTGLPGLRVLVLDQRLHPVPFGVTGEIYLAGLQVARGYHHRPDLTATRFVADPLGGGVRLYRTGDLGAWGRDGTLRYLGRADDQVQVRGFRVELGEVEAAVLAAPGVRSAAVLAREDVGGTRQLVAYVTGTDDHAAVRDAVARILPHHMVPSSVVPLDTLPLTAHGKLDRAALPAPVVATAYRAPRDEVEHAVAAAFAEVLGLPRIGVDDDFFALGGTSLRMFGLQRALATRLDAEVPVTTLLEAGTVAELARRLRENPAPTRTEGPLADTALDPEITPAGLLAHRGPATDVLLTGATGFLGAYLLRELLDRTTARVWCLVRAASVEHGMARIHTTLENYRLWEPGFATRIIAVPGDLAAPDLGLSGPDRARLAEQIHVIYHNGARVNHLEPYARLRQANVEGTREVLRLATTAHAKPVHFVSTTGSVVAAGETTPVTEDTARAAADLIDSGYVISKWTAEQLLFQARDRGLPVRVYRPGLISGDLQFGAHNPDDSFWNMIRAAALLGAAPDVVDATVSLTPVTYVARALVEISLRAPRATAFHLVNRIPVPVAAVLDALRRNGFDITTADPAEISARLHHEAHRRDAAGDDTLVRAALLSTGYTDGIATLDFDDTNTRTTLRGTGIACPALTPADLDTYIRAFRTTGFLPAPDPAPSRPTLSG
ncbi:amino acid adenylation domain-containing protein [Nocardia higoensis]|uniref:Amino acid adenylation domain-containing protein n=1 Tax=Nocardia higoensis TaxID=228599 RepID=A0ABS0D984_9NOCA|nr:amino acid adenylation domain-containing protein [Nocardia higoensis]MBF6355032.1 amino acid adenylation domain-containing protein [Nocardia higoensis]